MVSGAGVLALLVLAAPAVVGFFVGSDGSLSHDWIVFDTHASKSDAEYMFEVAGRLQEMAVGTLAVGTPVTAYVKTKVDMAASWTGEVLDKSAVIKAVSNGVYTVEVTHSRGKETFGGLGPSQVFWGHIGECMDLAVQRSLGFHSDGGDFNGMMDDDARTLASDWLSRAKYYHVDDRYARAAAMVTCAFFGDSSMRNYQKTTGALWSAARRGLARFLDFSSSAWPPTKRAMNELLSTDARSEPQLCWDFVTDMVDLLHFGVEGNTDALRLFGLSKPIPEHESTLEMPRTLVRVQSDDKRARAQTCAMDPSPSNVFMWVPTEREMQSHDATEFATDPEAQPLLGELGKSAGKSSEYEFSTSYTYDVPSDMTSLVSLGRVRTSDMGGSLFAEVSPSTGRVVSRPSVQEQGLFERSSASIGAFSRASTTVSAYYAYRALKSSESVVGTVEASAEWLDRRLGRVGAAIGSGVVRIVAGVVGAWKFLVSQALLASARATGLCSWDMTDSVCVCDVVEPLVAMVDQLESEYSSYPTDASTSGDNGAVTLLLSKGVSGHVSAAQGGLSSGLYITFHWKINGHANIGFDIGYMSGTSVSAVVGTDMISAGASATGSVGLFFGLKSDMAPYTKGFSLGLNAFGHVSAGLSLLFRHHTPSVGDCLMHYSDESELDELGRMFVWPVNVRCLRGFTFYIQFGVKAIPTGVAINTYTSVGVGKKISLLAASSDTGFRSEFADHVRAVLGAAGRSMEEHNLTHHASKRAAIAGQLDQLEQDLLAIV